MTAWIPNTIWERNDHCIGFFEQFWVANRIEFPHGARVLEVGCAEANWVTKMKELRPDLHLTCVDQRPYPPRPGANVMMLGNLLDPKMFGQAQFDAVVAISTIEHVGIGRYGDQADDHGDSKAMANIKRWLKPDGFLYMDVPYRGDGPTERTACQWAYSEKDLQSRVIWPWKECDRQVYEVDHEDAPYIALVLRPL